nr:S8 family serine peptidase [Thermoleophilaceae bacterium]
MRRLLLTLVPMVLLAPAAQASNDPLYPQQWNLAMVESDAAHAVTRGAGATVAVVDTGFTPGHPDLGGRMVGGFDFVDNDGDPTDGEGHGTHVSGIIVANENNGIGVGSVAPEARLLAVRVLDDEGSGSNADVQAGIDYAVKQGADVINLSLGPDIFGTLLGGSDPAIDRALDAGVVVVAAAGNSAAPLCQNPSGQGRLLCVGAVDRGRQRSSFSSFGFGLGLMGPGGSGSSATGEDVLSTLKNGGYGEMAGTSQAAPHVAGVAALLASSGVKGQAAVRRILATASDAGPAGPDALYGAGIVN